jgi:hypothetical protein
MHTVLRRVPILAILGLLACPLMPLAAQATAGSAAVEEIAPSTEKISSVEVMLDNHFSTLRGSLFSTARGYSPADAKNPWAYQAYQVGGKKYAIGWVMFQDNDSKKFVTNLIYFKEKEPGKMAFTSGVTNMDGRVEKVMFAKVAADLADPTIVVVGSQYVFADSIAGASGLGLMNYDPGKSKIAQVELMTNRIIVSLKNPDDGTTSEKFFDWSSAGKSFQWNFKATR